jgi:UDP-N-acetylglucosamine 3-dehydrogenase
MLRIGIVGAGDISARHAEAYEKIPGTVIAAWVDAVPEKARQRAERFGGAIRPSMERLLEAGEVDIVDLCTPDALHTSQAAAALRAGCHVLCEKPLGVDLDDAMRVVAQARESGKVFMVGQVLRFFPAYRWMHRFLGEASIGVPFAVSASRLNPYPQWRGWFRDGTLSGGAVLDLMVHDADYCHWLFGRAKRVSAIGRRDRHGIWNHVQALVSFRSGVAATLEAGYLMPAGFPAAFLLRVICENGCVEYTNRAERPVTVFEPGQEPQSPEISAGDPFLDEIRHFIGCVERNERPTIVRPEEALHSLAIVLAARESLDRGGEPVTVEATPA